MIKIGQHVRSWNILRWTRHPVGRVCDSVPDRSFRYSCKILHIVWERVSGLTIAFLSDNHSQAQTNTVSSWCGQFDQADFLFRLVSFRGPVTSIGLSSNIRQSCIKQRVLVIQQKTWSLTTCRQTKRFVERNTTILLSVIKNIFLLKYVNVCLYILGSYVVA